MLQWRIIAFSVSIMNIYNQSHGLATTPTGRNNKVGSYQTCNDYGILAFLRDIHSMLLIGDSIFASLSRYQTVSNKYFKTYKVINCGISGDRTQHLLWKEEDLFVPPSLKFDVVYYGTTPN